MFHPCYAIVCTARTLDRYAYYVYEFELFLPVEPEKKTAWIRDNVVSIGFLTIALVCDYVDPSDRSLDPVNGDISVSIHGFGARTKNVGIVIFLKRDIAMRWAKERTRDIRHRSAECEPR